jgi:hypothetical protein
VQLVNILYEIRNSFLAPAGQAPGRAAAVMLRGNNKRAQSTCCALAPAAGTALRRPPDACWPARPTARRPGAPARHRNRALPP